MKGGKPESRNKVVAGGSNVAGVGEVALVQIVAPRPIPGQALGAHPALVVWRLLYVVALNVFEAGSRHFLADIWHTICSVTSVPLHATKIYIRLILSYIPEDRAHTYKRVGYCLGSKIPPRSKALPHMHPAHKTDRHPVLAASNENSVSLHVSTL